MKLSTESNVISSAGLKTSSSFQIAATPQAFRILSSRMYSDKIRAVIREIGCNAVDAHITAGKPDLPIEVHLPSRLYSKFYIKDFGPGMSPDEILELYTTYFASSKRNDNNTTGAYGLGSKSPFSYTDSFTIVSAHAGVKTTYAAYIGETDEPTISKVDEGPTDPDWPSGLMVSMPVQPQDYYEFQTKAQQVFQWFKVPPKMVNSPPVKPISFSFETEDFAIPEDNSLTEVMVLMGNVAYPVPYAELDFDWVHNVRPVLKLPIGAVDVAVSREALEFTPRTRATIANAMDTVTKHFAAEVVDKVKQFDLTTLEGIKEAHKWLSSTTTKWSYGQMHAFLKTGLSQDEIVFLEPLMNSRGFVRVPADFEGKITAYHVNNRGHLRTESYTYDKSTWNRNIPGNIHSIRAILLRGDAKYLKDRLRYALRSGAYDMLFVVADDDADAEKIAAQWYNFPTVRAEDLELPDGWLPPSKRSRGQRRLKADTATCNYVRFDLQKGTYSVEEDFVLSEATDREKFFIHSTTAWGSVRWWFENVARRDYNTVFEILAKILPHVPDAPYGVALLKKGEVTRYKLVEKRGWKDFKAIADMIRSQEVRNLVHNVRTESLSTVYSDGSCYEYGNVLRLLASHARADSAFWKALVHRCPDAHLIALARKYADGNIGVTSDKPINVANYNDFFRCINDYSSLITVARTIGSDDTGYPLTEAAMCASFPNSGIKIDLETTADIFAQLIRRDEAAAESKAAQSDILDLAA